MRDRRLRGSISNSDEVDDQNDSGVVKKEEEEKVEEARRSEIKPYDRMLMTRPPKAEIAARISKAPTGPLQALARFFTTRHF